MKLLGWTLNQHEWCFYETRKSGHKQTSREDQVKTQGEDGHLHEHEKGLRRNQTC